MSGGASGIQIDVIVQVGQLPFESRRIGQHAQLVFMELKHSVYNFQDNLTAGQIGKTPVNGRGTGVDGYHMDFLYGFHHFIDRTAASQYPRNQLQVGNAFSLQCRLKRFVLAVVGEIKQSRRQSGLVQSFGHKFLLLHCQSHVTVTGRKLHSVGTARYIRLLGVSARHNHIAAVQVTATPFDGTCQNLCTVF